MSNRMLALLARSAIAGGALMLLVGCAEQSKGPAAVAKTDRAADEAEEIRQAIAQLPEAERAVAAAQKICPVGGGALGSMGMPYKVTAKGRDVYLCCEGCQQAIEENPDEYLAKLPPAE